MHSNLPESSWLIHVTVKILIYIAQRFLMTTAESSLLGDSIANRFSLCINIATYESIIAEFVSIKEDACETRYIDPLIPVLYDTKTFGTLLDLNQDMHQLGRYLRVTFSLQMDPGSRRRAESKADQCCIRLERLRKQLATIHRNFVRYVFDSRSWTSFERTFCS